MHVMRRKDREVTGDQELRGILERCEVCRIGLSADGEVYIVPLNFGYELQDGRLLLYFHCAPEGRKLDMMAKNPRVCFEMDCDGGVITGEQGCDYSYRYSSLMGEGILQTLTRTEDKIHAFECLLSKYAGDREFTYSERDIDRTTVLRLTVNWTTGKRHQ